MVDMEAADTAPVDVVVSVLVVAVSDTLATLAIGSVPETGRAVPVIEFAVPVVVPSATL